MNAKLYLKSWLHRIAEEVKSTLPDEIEFDFRKHVLPLFFPFLAWKDELKNRETLRADFLAGVVGAIIVLPQGIAFAMIAGLPPVYGLYTAMVTPIVAALFGSSRHLVSGPTTPISIVIFAAVSTMAAEGSPEYIEKVLLLTFMAGAIQFGLGLGRMGRYISFVSHTVVVGFTAGAAMLIITNQMKGVLGLQISSRAAFIETWKQILGQLGSINLSIFAVAVFTLLVASTIKRYWPRAPNLMLGLAFGTGLAWLMGGPEAGIPFVSSIPRQLPSPSLPGFSASNFHQLLGDAFAIALLGLIEAVAISRAISLKSGQVVDSNQEFIGQGLSNVVGSFFFLLCRFGVLYSVGGEL